MSSCVIFNLNDISWYVKNASFISLSVSSCLKVLPTILTWILVLVLGGDVKGYWAAHNQPPDPLIGKRTGRGWEGNGNGTGRG